MTIQDWIDNGCHYEQGILLYAQFGKNQILLKRFQKNKSDWNEDKLKNELLKFQDIPQTFSRQVPDTLPTEPVNLITEPTKPEESPAFKEIKSKPMSDYPVELHPVYQLRVSSFYRYASLKLQLNKLAPEAESEALKIQFDIWEAVKINDKCWTILRHFDDTGRIMPLETSEDFSSLTPIELFNRRQQLRANKSKREATIREMEIKLFSETNAAKKIKLENTISEKKEFVQQMNNDIEQLTSLINGK